MVFVNLMITRDNYIENDNINDQESYSGMNLPQSPYQCHFPMSLSKEGW